MRGKAAQLSLFIYNLKIRIWPGSGVDLMDPDQSTGPIYRQIADLTAANLGADLIADLDFQVCGSDWICWIYIYPDPDLFVTNLRIQRISFTQIRIYFTIFVSGYK